MAGCPGTRAQDLCGEHRHLTTALGLMPLALGLGEGAEMRAPMAIAVIGGLLLSAALTLVVIPVVYSLLDRRRTEADLESLDGEPVRS
jgi:HAE1 family hydrophobic/amphiphilic exporter-1